MVKKVTLFISGMTCGSCEKRIENTLLSLEGVENAEASFSKSKVEVTYEDDSVSHEILTSSIEKLGYDVMEKPGGILKGVLPLLILLFGGFYIIKNTIGFNFIPEISENMGYGLIFVAGILTSVHCIAMCGGIALSQSISGIQHKGNLVPSFLYNVGRVISYTVIGGIVGGLGAVLTPSGQFKGTVAIVAGVFMVLMGLKMLNIVRFPNWLKLKIPIISYRQTEIAHPLRPLFVGLFNGFMPCGPLQTMQLYALGTGSVMKGALSMFFFSVGTLPLLFLFGAIATMINGKLSKNMMKISAILVIILGIVMSNRGFALSGMALDYGSLNTVPGKIPEIKMEDGNQIVNMSVSDNRYTLDTPIVKVGTPVKIKLDVKSINGCNNPVIIPEYGVQANLDTPDPVIEFTPTKEGTIRISCWMGMITTKLIAVDDPSKIDEKELKNKEQEGLFNDNEFFGGGCCSIGQVQNKAAIATIEGNIQTVEMNVGSYGYSPNILVVQKGLETRWVINVDEINGCNYLLTIPENEYYVELKNKKNEIRFKPQKTGEIVFTCSMNMLLGKVVIVEDLANVDVQALEESTIKNTIKAPGGRRGSCH